MKKQLQLKQERAFEILSALFITTLIVSNIASVKIVSIAGAVFDAGTILFPLAYIVGDVLAEVYGYMRVRRLVWTSAGMLLMTMATLWIVDMLPASVDWTLTGSFSDILGVVWRIVIASIAAMIAGELLNAFVLTKMKAKNDSKRLWDRLVVSSAFGNAADTIIFTTIAFAGTMPLDVFFNVIMTVWVIKMTVEICASPLTIRIIRLIQR
ncbi:MAG: queuosine precursor transporter [Candidatus Saccharimonadales bacterium]